MEGREIECELVSHCTLWVVWVFCKGKYLVNGKD